VGATDQALNDGLRTWKSNLKKILILADRLAFKSGATDPILE